MESIVYAQPKFESKKMIFGKYRELFFVGIGGSGMSGIAEVLHNLGYKISGSDTSPGDTTEHLERLGIKVYDKHQADNIGTANVVVISSAVRYDNPEVVEAHRLGIPVIKRAEMLGELMRLKYSVGVSGTHGKTTTTSMLGKIMTDAGLDPTVIVGGIVVGHGSGASLGSGDYFVAEADEYDKSFLSMFPAMALVTNVEPDHLECYDGMEDLKASFLTYMNRVPFYGQVVYNADDPILRELKDKISRAAVSFGLSSGADYQALEIKSKDGKSRFSVFHKDDLLGEVVLNIPGMHNVKNALAAIAAACELEIPFDGVVKSLSSFAGVSRRFEIKGVVNDIVVIDDYAHHPTEIRATLETARSAYRRRIIVAFQPHLFSRTQMFYREFAESLMKADVCLILDIFPAREEPVAGVTAELIMNEMLRMEHSDVRCIGPKKNAVGELSKIAKPGDLIITMGAGSITHINPELLEKLKDESQNP